MTVVFSALFINRFTYLPTVSLPVASTSLLCWSRTAANAEVQIDNLRRTFVLVRHAIHTELFTILTQNTASSLSSFQKLLYFLLLNISINLFAIHNLLF